MQTTLRALLIGSAALALVPFALAQDAADIDFGDDDGLWSNDGECDDPRFEGDAMASMLEKDDILHDATDCQTAYLAGEITLSAPQTEIAAENAALTTDIDFGDDDGLFANDGECDDVRFAGPAMTTTGFLESDVGHDASDCKADFEAGEIYLRGPGDTSMEALLEESADETVGEITGEITGESETETFTGPGLVDAYDDPPANGVMFNGINFGDDTSEWAADGECDDPRFGGAGMTDTTLLPEDAYHDAADCLAAWKTGALQLVD